LVLNVNNVSNTVTSKVEIQCFLKNDITKTELSVLEDTIKGISGVRTLKYTSKSQALEGLKTMLGENKSLADGLNTENPLPSSFQIKVNKPENVKFVSEQLSKMDVFEKINDGETIVDQIIQITRFIKYASFILMAVLGIVAISLISNTIKLTVFARKREIGIMKYIGATDWFIRWPFIIEGIILGLIGGVIADLLVFISYAYVSSQVSKNPLIFSMVATHTLMDKIGFMFCVVGVAIGGLGSMLSIRKFLVK
jgi:cell division transport system permease protein